MTEDEARNWVDAHYPEAADRLERLVALVLTENASQNLIAPSTTAAIWARHVVDSLQLLRLVPEMTSGVWMDVGTGGGFPGLAVAVLYQDSTVLIEPRGRRAEFLRRAAAELGLTHVRVEQARAETIVLRSAVISARAVASVDSLLDMTSRAAGPGTLWLLPRGKVAADDRVAAEQRGLMFHVEQSVTAPESKIVVLRRMAASS